MVRNAQVQTIKCGFVDNGENDCVEKMKQIKAMHSHIIHHNKNRKTFTRVIKIACKIMSQK